MHLSEIVEKLQALETHMSDLGFVKPEVKPWIHFCGRLFFVKIEAYTSDNLATRELLSSPSFTADTEDEIPEVFEKLTRWIDEQETPAQRREADFMKTLAHLIDEGREIGTPILADLEATMKRLSTNILTSEAVQ